MSLGPINLRYIPAQFRVRVEFSKAHTLQSEKPPPDVARRAQAKLQAEQEKGALKFYEFYQERFERVWAMVRVTEMAGDALIAVTLGAGAPDMPGILVTAPAEKEAPPKLTITTNVSQLAAWSFDLFKLTVYHQLIKLGHKALIDPAHLHLLHYKACQGKKIHEEDLIPLPQTPAKEEEQFHLHVDARAGAIKVIAYDIAAIVDQENVINDIVNAVIRKARELKDRHGWEGVILKEAIVRKLRSAGRGPERYGLDLPLVLLGAIRREGGQQRTASMDGRIQIGLSEDKMTAVIRRVDPSLYEESAQVTPEAWMKYFTGKGLRHGLDEAAIQEFINRLKAKQSCDNLVMAQGTAPKAGAGPKLVPRYQDAALKDETLSMRDRQATSFVRAGQLVAEIRFETSARPGRTVTGEVREAPNPELPSVKVGEGIEARGLQFYAIKDGVPVLSDDEIAITPALVLKQNVNMVSGNVRFDGPVEIHGDIESGAIVETNADLIVHGMIEGGSVRVGGNLTVDGGIIGARDGFVRVKGDVLVDFLDNARLKVNGNVTVKKTITASDLTVEKRIVVEAEQGLIIGGHVRAWEEISAANVGRSTGALTHLTVGHNMKAERALAVREKRLEHLQHALKEEKANLRTLKGKAPNELSQKGTKRRARTLSRLQHLQVLVDRVVEQVHAAKANLSYSDTAVIVVADLLTKTAVITVAGHRVPVKDDVRGVKIAKDGPRKPQITAIEENPQKNNPDKKAG